MNEEPKQSGCGAQKIGVHDFASLVEILENTFKRLYGRTSDPQDMIQYMEATILDFRKREADEEAFQKWRREAEQEDETRA